MEEEEDRKKIKGTKVGGHMAERLGNK